MRLADVKWAKEDEKEDYEFATVYCGDARYTIGRDPLNFRQWWYGYNAFGKIDGPVNFMSALEFACFLSDKEPA